MDFFNICVGTIYELIQTLLKKFHTQCNCHMLKIHNDLHCEQSYMLSTLATNTLWRYKMCAISYEDETCNKEHLYLTMFCVCCFEIEKSFVPLMKYIIFTNIYYYNYQNNVRKCPTIRTLPIRTVPTITSTSDKIM